MDQVSAESVLLPALALIVLALLVMAAITWFVTKPWLRAMMHGTPVSVVNIIGTRLRGNPVTLLIDAYILIHRAGIPATYYEVENIYVDTRSRISTYDDLVEIVKREFGDRDEP